MHEQKCSECGQVFAEEYLLTREDTGELVCEECSGLLVDEDISCRYDEW
jgi:DNA-directed RNA polymerase subunit RPC12/RpoP